MFRKRLLLFFFYTIAFTVLGQTYTTKHYSTSNKLPSNKIRSVYLDSRGLLWIGTSNGLCQYNGFEFKTYTEKDGIIGKEIWAITEDKNGNLWTASYNDGLSKFNGNKFTNFTINDGLISNNIRTLSVNDSNHILIGTEEGLSIYHKNQFQNFKINKEKSEGRAQIMSFFRKNKEQYFLTFTNGVYKINHTPKGYSINQINDYGGIQYIEDKEIYLYQTGSGIFTGEARKRLDYTKKTPQNIKLSHDIVWDIEKINNSIYMASWNVGNPGGGLLKWENGELENIGGFFYGITSEQVWALEYDPTNKILWIATLDDGLYSIDLSHIVTTYSYAPIFKKKNKSKSRKKTQDVRIRDAKIKGKNTWMLADVGLIKITSADTILFGEKKFIDAYHKFYTKPIKKRTRNKLNSLKDISVESNKEKEIRYSVMLGEFKRSSFKDGRTRELLNKYLSIVDLEYWKTNDTTTVYYVGMYENKNEAILRQSDLKTKKNIINTKIVTVSEDGIIKEAKQNLEQEKIKEKGKTQKLIKEAVYGEETIRVIEKTTEAIDFITFRFYSNNIYIMTFQGLFKLDLNNNVISFVNEQVGGNCLSFEIYNDTSLLVPNTYGDFYIYESLSQNEKKRRSFKPSDPNTPINVFVSVNTGSKVYLASWQKGLFCYNEGKPVSLIKEKLFLEKRITCIHYNKEQLYIASDKGDIYIANVKDTFTVQDIISKNQIRGNHITSIDTWKEMLILTTNKGLNVFKKGKIRFFDEQQGLINKGFDRSFIENEDLFLYGKEKYYKIDLSEISFDEGATQNFITNIRINNQNDPNYNYNAFNPCEEKSISFPYNKNNLELTLSKEILSFKNNNSAWQEIKNNKIFLIELSKGTHLISIKTRYNKGVIKEEGLITIIIKAPYWQTSWFWTILTVVIFLFIRRLIQKEKTKANLRNQLTEARLEALQSQMNPHFIFNTLNSIQNYIIDHKVDDALMYMGHFSTLIRQTLDNSTHSHIPLLNVIEYLNTYIKVENIRFDNKIKLKVESNDIDLEKISIPPMLIQPLIENAIVHGFKEVEKEFKISITFIKQDKHIKCSIRDNGAGFDFNKKEKNKAFHALEALKERVLLLQENNKKELEILSNSNGTTIILLIAYNTVA